MSIATQIWDIVSPAIMAIDAKFNYIRAALYSSGSATWIKTSGPPGSGDGTNGNYCIDTVNFHAYGPKTSGAWGSPISFGGASGFLTGSGAPSSGLGTDGNLYLDTVSGLLYGPKAGGAWGSGTAIAGAKLGAIGALSWAADQFIYLTGAATAAAASLTSFVRGLLGSADASAFRTGLGLGDSATRNVGTTAGTVCAGDDSRLSGGLPSQTGNAGKVLTTDGTNLYWIFINALPTSYVALHLHMDGSNGSTTFVDVHGHAIVAHNSAQISTIQSKFGSASAYFNGAGAYLDCGDYADCELGSVDWTLEAWIYLAGYASNYNGFYASIIIGKDAVGARAFHWKITGTASSWTSMVFSTAGTEVTVSWTPSLNTWYHVAVCKSGSSLRFFVNGNQQGATQTHNTAIAEVSPPLIVGCILYTGYQYYFNGFIDELRITKGVALYTSNFTPPTAAFPD